MFIFPVYNLTSPTTLAPCSPAAALLELLQSCLNFVEHKEEAISYLCNLVKQVPAFRLSFNSGRAATDLLAKAYQDRRRGSRVTAIKEEVSLLS
jgi:hypothetical protein